MREEEDIRGDGLLSGALAFVRRLTAVAELGLLRREARLDDVRGLAVGSRGGRSEEGDGEEELHLSRL